MIIVHNEQSNGEHTACIIYSTLLSSCCEQSAAHAEYHMHSLHLCEHAYVIVCKL